MAEINDLLSDLLVYLFGFLSVKQLFQIECVCIKWQKCVRKILEKKIKLHSLSYYSENKFFNLSETYSGAKFVDETNIKTLEIILKKCPNIQSINLTSTQIKGKNILLTIGKLCPKLQEISLDYTLIDVNDEGVKEFAEMIGPQLIKCKLDQSIFEFSKLMLMHMKNIEEVSFRWPESKEQSQYLISQLKSCEKLKKVTWIVDENQNIDSNHDFACVIQRLQYLKTNLSLVKLFNFGLENLTQLKIHCEACDNQFPNNEINFINLTKLVIIIYEEDVNFELFYKWKMPKLEYLQLYDSNYKDKFFRHIKNIKSFKCNRLNLYQMDQIYRINKKLINFECDIVHIKNEDDLTNFCDCIDVLIKHKSIQNIKFDYIYDILFNVQLFDKLIELVKSKSNVNVTIEIEKIMINLLFDEYKKKFEEIKLKNLQMKIEYFNYDDVLI